MATVRVRINELLRQKAIRDGRNPDKQPITQQELALAIDVPQGTISRWAGNKVDRLDKAIMVKLCQYFKCDIGDLLTYEDHEVA